jgi:hypothetical protein
MSARVRVDLSSSSGERLFALVGFVGAGSPVLAALTGCQADRVAAAHVARPAATAVGAALLQQRGTGTAKRRAEG